MRQVMVFSWSGCPFCKNAKALLADVGADFTALELDTIGQEGKQIRAELAAVSAAAVHQPFIGQ
jgi:glutaredoxin